MKEIGSIWDQRPSQGTFFRPALPCCPALLSCLALLPCPALLCLALPCRTGQGRTPCRAKTQYFLFFRPIERSRRNPCYFLFLGIRDDSCISNRITIYFHYQKSSCDSHRKKPTKWKSVHSLY